MHTWEVSLFDEVNFNSCTQEWLLRVINLFRAYKFIMDKSERI